MEWKKFMPLGLVAALLVSCLALWATLQRTEKRLESLLETTNQLQAESTALQETVRLLEESRASEQALVKDCEISVLGIDTKKQRLSLFLSLALNREEPGVLSVIVRSPGDAKEFQRTSGGISLQLNGRYTGQLELPIDASVALELSLQTNQDGVLHEEPLSSYPSMAALLPIQLTSVVGDVLYNGERKFFYWTEWAFAIKESSKVPAELTNPVLRVYKNGRLAVENLCVELEAGVYGDAKDGSQLACNPGDTVEFRFACTDAYGLGYEFPIQWWEMTENDKITHWPADPRPTLSWNG